MVTARAVQWSDPVTDHGEGPVWDVEQGALRCVDMLAGDVLTLRDGRLVEREHVGAVAAAWRPRHGGGAVVAVERGFVLVGPDGARQSVGPLWEETDVRMNEGGCDAAGAFYSGSMQTEAEPGRGRLWRLDPDGSTSLVLGDLTISNGLVFRPDGRAYFVDTPTRRIDLLSFDEAGGVADRRPFADLAGVTGQPDGIALDVEGGVWVAQWGGGAVLRLDPDGSVTATVELVVPCPTAVAFGGPEMDQLFVTTSRLEDPQDPSGAIFTFPAEVRGRAVNGYGG